MHLLGLGLLVDAAAQSNAAAVVGTAALQPLRLERSSASRNALKCCRFEVEGSWLRFEATIPQRSVGLGLTAWGRRQHIGLLGYSVHLCLELLCT